MIGCGLLFVKINFIVIYAWFFADEVAFTKMFTLLKKASLAFRKLMIFEFLPLQY